MAKDFAVVSFPNDGNNEEEIVSEVPVLWLRSNLTQCWWPSIKNINTFIAKQIPPVTLSGHFILLNFMDITCLRSRPFTA